MVKLLSSLPVGAKVVDPDTRYNGKPITWLVGGHGHYAQGQTVLVSEKIITLKPFDAKEASNTDGSRKDYGNNRYGVSNIRQWLNSNESSWYSAQHSTDAPPTSANVMSGNNDYDKEKGFLTNFSASLRNALITTPLTTAKNTATDGGGSEIVSDRVFLLSNTEIGFANENNIAEGKLLPLFNSDTSRMAYPTADTVTNSEYKDATGLTASKPWLYWLRSPFTSGSEVMRGVNSSGTLHGANAFNGVLGVRPALNLSSDVEVSSTPNSNGEYELILPELKTRTLSSLPAGTKVVDPNTKYNGAPITWLVGGHDHYAQGQTVLVSEKVITLKPFDAQEPSNTDTARKNYGNNRYSVSNIRQWLNSDKASWYSAQHSVDAPPSISNVQSSLNSYDLEKGFLTNFSTTMLKSLVSVPLTVAKNTVTDGGGKEVVNDKVFLLSNTEVGLANENSIAEGKLLPLFSNNIRTAYPTTGAVSQSEYQNTSILAPSRPLEYYLRAPYNVATESIRTVDSYGSLSNSNSYSCTDGVRPALNIKSEILVTDVVNANGEYEILPMNIEPQDGTELSGIYDSSLILKYVPSNFPASTTVTEKVNGVVVSTKSVVNGSEYKVSATPSQWATVKYGGYRDVLGNRNVVTLEMSTGQIFTYPISKTLPHNAKTEDVLVAVNDMSNIAMPSHKKKLVDAIGNRATVGGTGTLEDIAKAIESINLESLNGVRVARGTTTIPSSGKLTISGLNFKPQLLVYISTRKNSLGYRAVAVVGRDVDYAGDPYARVSFQEHANGTYKPPSIFTDTSITMEGASSVSGETINYIVYGGTIL